VKPRGVLRLENPPSREKGDGEWFKDEGISIILIDEKEE
jgi:hypothetical protein